MNTDSYLRYFIVWVIAAWSGTKCDTESENELSRVRSFLKRYDHEATLFVQQAEQASWNYESNLTDHNLELSSLSLARLSDYRQEASKNASHFNTQLLGTNENVLRQLERVKVIGISLGTNDTIALNKIIGDMSGTYGKATICGLKADPLSNRSITDCSIKWSLDPEITKFMANSRNFDDLAQVFNEWHRVAGKPIKKMFQNYVKLSNKGARQGGFNDTGAWWRSNYEEPDFEKELEDLWYQILPLYENLHAYVRKKLLVLYPTKFNTSALPAHILGNMWAQDWINLLDFLLPYPSRASIDVTDEMVRQNYTVNRMFRVAEQFYTSLGLQKMPDDFWRKSILEKPQDGRSMICHASAWDFYQNADSPDVRIKMCTVINMDNLITIHHEMGHVTYYLNYINQPLVFREGANPGFHEAIGDTLALSSSAPKHLKAIGLLANYTEDFKQDINHLFKMALEKIAFLPFGYLVDKWRYNVFNGKYDLNTWNSAWWNLKYAYQGVLPPYNKDQTDAFDPGAKFHVPADTPYASYFVSFIIQFQFYKAMCDASGHQGALHHCDFYESKAAGKLLADMLKLGSSKHWSQAMKQMTGQSKMDASALFSYFRPLNDWLTEKNRGECFGWGYEWPPNVQTKLNKPRCEKHI